MRRFTFQTSHGFKFQLDVSDDDTLDNIKLKIRTDYGFATSSHTLIFDGVAIYTDAELLAALRRLADGSVIQLHLLPTSERPLPSEASTSNFTRADSDAVSLSEIDASLIDGFAAIRVDGSPSERPLPEISNEASTSDSARADPDGVSMPEAVIVEQAADLLAAAFTGKAADDPTKPSTSSLSEDLEEPEEPEEPAPPQPANPGDMTVWLVSGPWKKAITVHEDAEVGQIRSAITETYNVQVPDEIKFALNRCFVLEEDESFKRQRIKHNGEIEFLASDEVRAQFFLDFQYQAAAAAVQAALQQFQDALYDTTILTVTVKHGEARTEVEVLPGQMVGFLKLMLAEINFPLPAKGYGFLHGTILLNESLSFAAQGVSDGDEIKIAY